MKKTDEAGVLLLGGQKQKSPVGLEKKKIRCGLIWIGVILMLQSCNGRGGCLIEAQKKNTKEEGRKGISAQPADRAESNPSREDLKHCILETRGSGGRLRSLEITEYKKNGDPDARDELKTNKPVKGSVFNPPESLGTRREVLNERT